MGRACLATRGAEGPTEATQARQALAGGRIVHPPAAGAAQSCLALVIDVLSDLFILRGIPAHIRSDNGPEFVAKAVQEWIAAIMVVRVAVLIVNNRPENNGADPATREGWFFTRRAIAPDAFGALFTFQTATLVPAARFLAPGVLQPLLRSPEPRGGRSAEKRSGAALSTVGRAIARERRA